MLRQTFLVPALFGLATLAVPAIASAQAQLTDGRVYIQVASHPTLEEAVARANTFAAAFPETSVYYTSSGWYAVIVGAAPVGRADAVIAGLVADAHVPNDTLATPGKGYIAKVWPLSTADAGSGSDLAQAQQMEAGWSRSTKEGVQNALIWSGDYVSKIDGEFGQSTRNAIRSFQSKRAEAVTGYLTGAQIAALEAVRQRLVDAIGYEVVRDYQSGVIVGFPTGMFDINSFEKAESEFLKVIPGGGTATDGSIILISHRYFDGAVENLADTVYQLDFVPAGAYRATRDDWFVVSGDGYDTGTYAYARRFGNEVKGFILIWPRDEDIIYKPLSVAMFNSLDSIPGITFEAFVAKSQPSANFQKPEEPDRVAEPNGGAPLGGSSGTGFFVNGEGYLLTNQHVIEGCTQFQYGTSKLELVVADKDRDLAILRDPARPADAPFARFAAAPIKLNADVTAIGFPLQGYIKGLNVTRGAVSGMYGLFGGAEGVQITAPVQPGNSGGPLVDEFGMIVGVVQSKLNALVAAEQVGDLPQNVNFAIRGETAKTYLSQNSVDMTVEMGSEPLRPEDLAQVAQSFTVRIECE